MTIRNFPVQSNRKLSFHKAKSNIDITFDSISKMFSKKTVNKIALETGFTKRSSSKISGYEFLISLLASSHSNSHCSLEKICEIVTRVSHKVRITAQSLMERINSHNSVKFLKQIYENVFKEKILKISAIPSTLLESFSKILLHDSSSIVLHEELQKYFKGSGGRASSSSIKFDVIYDYKTKEYEQISLTDHGEADSKLASKVEDFLDVNSLVIRDLGYLRVDCLLQIISKKAFFLSRLKANVNVYLQQQDKNPTDISNHIARKYKNYEIVDLQVFITDEKLPVRLIAYKVPDEVVNRRRREAKLTAKKQSRTLRKKTLRFFNYTIFITNVPVAIWKPEVIGTVYSVRWQIELIFKCWKSRMEIHYLKGISPERIKCLILARLILLLLINHIYRLVEFIGLKLLQRQASMAKVFEWMKDTDRLIRIMKGSVKKLERTSFISSITMCMCMQKRKRQTTFEHICACEIYGKKMELA